LEGEWMNYQNETSERDNSVNADASKTPFCRKTGHEWVVFGRFDNNGIKHVRVNDGFGNTKTLSERALKSYFDNAPATLNTGDKAPVSYIFKRLSRIAKGWG